MKKNYFLTLVVTLLMAVTASAADSLVGIYKLSNLTDEQKSELGSINADAAFRILPGDANADYYVSGVAGYGCKFPAIYNEAAGTLTAIEPSEYAMFELMILYFSDMEQIVVDGTSIVFNVKSDGTLELAKEIIVTQFMGDIYGQYIPGIALEKNETPVMPTSDVVGDYTFTGTGVKDFWNYTTEEINYSVSIVQAEGNALTINGFMDVDGIQATYIPEVGMILIATQDIGEVSVGDIYFTVSGGELELISPATAGPKNDMPYVSITKGKAVKESTNAIESMTAAATVYVRNGAIYVNSAEPVTVQVYNAAGVQVYADAAVNGPITLPRGIYFVKVGNAKAVSVAL